MFGLTVIDSIVIIIYFLLLILIGIVISKRIKHEDDFLVGGRGFGKLLQTFMNFGMATSADAPVGASREAFRQGMSGIWLQLFHLFSTPFFWLTTLWQRRLRLSSMGDFFRLRFDQRPIEKFYSIVNLFGLIAGMSLGMVALLKTVEVMVPKDPATYTVEEQQIVDNFHRYKYLDDKLKEDVKNLSVEELKEHKLLESLKSEGKVKSVISKINPKVFLLVISLILLIYTWAGGMIAAAITDLLQGVLMIILSLILLPIALSKIGWFSGLHARVDESLFSVFGNSAINEYPWYHIAALVLLGIMVTESSPFNMQVFGSAKNEETARVGRVNGMIMKRFTVLLWGFTGIVGIALYKNQVADVDNVWGYMTIKLLAPGLIGLMLVAILAALQSTVSAYLVATSALVIKNLYEPFFPKRSQKEYIMVGRIACAAILVCAIFITLYLKNFYDVLRFAWDIGLIFGTTFWLACIWRKLTPAGAWTGIIYSLIITFMLGNFAKSTKMAHSDLFCQQTNGYYVTDEGPATIEDVEDGKAKTVGEQITKKSYMPPVGIFFEKIVNVDKYNPNSELKGSERFRVHLLYLHFLGIDLSNFKKAELTSINIGLQVLMPFLLMILVSYFTRRNRKEVLNEFYGRLMTPVRGTQEEDDKEMALTRENPDRYKNTKIFPNSGIELRKPSKRDVVGFLIICAAVGVVILCMVGLAKLGS